MARIVRTPTPTKRVGTDQNERPRPSMSHNIKQSTFPNNLTVADRPTSIKKEDVDSHNHILDKPQDGETLRTDSSVQAPAANKEQNDNIELAHRQGSNASNPSSNIEPLRSSKRRRISPSGRRSEEEHTGSASKIYISPDYVQIIGDYVRELNTNTPFPGDSKEDDPIDGSTHIEEALFDIDDPVTFGASEELVSDVNGLPRYVIVAKAYHNCEEDSDIDDHNEEDAQLVMSSGWFYRLRLESRNHEGPSRSPFPFWIPENLIAFKAENDVEDSQDAEEDVQSDNEEQIRQDSEESNQEDSAEESQESSKEDDQESDTEKSQESGEEDSEQSSTDEEEESSEDDSEQDSEEDSEDDDGEANRQKGNQKPVSKTPISKTPVTKMPTTKMPAKMTPITKKPAKNSGPSK